MSQKIYLKSLDECIDKIPKKALIRMKDNLNFLKDNISRFPGFGVNRSIDHFLNDIVEYCVWLCRPYAEISTEELSYNLCDYGDYLSNFGKTRYEKRIGRELEFLGQSLKNIKKNKKEPMSMFTCFPKKDVNYNLLSDFDF